MKAISGTTIAVLTLALLGAALQAQQAVPPTQSSSPSFAYSKVRIVRLSQVNGPVQMDRNTGRGFESAMQNLPITEGVKLYTGSGYAEVEFEDGSTMRLAPGSLVEFPRLELSPTGAKATTVNVSQGTVYVSLANTKGNEFTVIFGSEQLNLPPSSHIRLQRVSDNASLSVLDGNVQVAGPSDTTALGKKKTLTFDLANHSQPALTKEVAENEYDAWDHQAVEYQKRYANNGAYGNAPYSYGISDMNYYGSFFDDAGCGSMWRPYFASAAWDPYGSGAWAWYPGAGYSWVSPYPWGWMPYHYGSWNFCPGVGWGWRPGGSWMGLSNVPGTMNPMRSPRGAPGRPLPIGQPHPPVHAPIPGQSTLVPVNLNRLPASHLGSRDNFVIRNDSAGLGIPRGSLGRLDKLSARVDEHGTISRRVYSAPISPAAGNGRMENGSASMRRGTMNRSGSEISPRSSERGQSPSGGMGRQDSGARSSGSMGSGGMGSGSAGHGSSAGGSSPSPSGGGRR